MSSPRPEQQAPCAGRSRGPDQDVLEDADAEVSLGIVNLVDHPVDCRHSFPVCPGARNDGPRQALRRGKALLKRHLGIYRSWIESSKPRIKQVQTLLGIVVAVKEQSGIRRMVVALVKTFKIGIGQIRDVPRIAARIRP